MAPAILRHAPLCSHLNCAHHTRTRTQTHTHTQTHPKIYTHTCVQCTLCMRTHTHTPVFLFSFRAKPTLGTGPGLGHAENTCFVTSGSECQARREACGLPANARCAPHTELHGLAAAQSAKGPKPTETLIVWPIQAQPPFTSAHSAHALCTHLTTPRWPVGRGMTPH